MAMLVALTTDDWTCPARLDAQAAGHAWGFGFATLPTSITLALPQQRARGQAGKAPRRN
jgi:hypothetical protein